jgi:hypothetical protein
MLEPLFLLLALGNAQQIYIDTDPIKKRPQCGTAKSAPSYDGATPTYGSSEFAYTQSSTRRTAISVPAPTTTTTLRAYAVCYPRFPRRHGVVGIPTTPKPRMQLIRMEWRRGVPNGSVPNSPTSPLLESTALQSLPRQYLRLN